MKLEEEFDVIVIGAGIAGASMAATLGKQGRKVALLERDLSEPDKIIGELLQPGGINRLKKLGLECNLNTHLSSLSLKSTLHFYDQIISPSFLSPFLSSFLSFLFPFLFLSLFVLFPSFHVHYHSYFLKGVWRG